MKKFLTLLAALIVMGSMMVVQADATRIYCKMEYNWWTQSGARIGIILDSNSPTAMTLVTGSSNTWYADVDLAGKTSITFRRIAPSNTDNWGAETTAQNIASNSIGTTNDFFTITNSTDTWSGNGNYCGGTWSTYVPEASFTFPAGTTIYYDFTAYSTTGINTYVGGNEAYYSSTDNVIAITLSSDWKVTASTKLWRCGAGGSWNDYYCTTLPTEGQDMIVSTDGIHYTWGTYGGGALPPASIKLHGNFTGSWADSDPFALAANEETASLTLTGVTKGNYEFGVKIADSWTSNGSAFTRANNSYEIVAGSGNCTFNADRNGDYIFTWTYATNTLEVTYPAIPAQSVALTSIASPMLKGTVVDFAATSSGIDNPGYRFYVKEKNGSYGEAVSSYTFNTVGEFTVKVEALEDNAGDPVASDEQEIAVYDAYTFTNGSTIYVDFTAMTEGAKGVNYPSIDQVGVDYDTNGAGTFKTVTFTADVTWTTNDDFIKTEKGGWAGLKFSVPGAGENCAVVAADGASYTWTTYVAPPPTIKMHGNFLGDWANTDAFVLAGNNETASLTLNIQAKGEKEFGVRIGSDDNWTSNGATISRASSSAEIISGSGNCKLDVDAKGDYTFTWTFASNTLAVTYPALPAQSVAFDGLAAQVLKGSNVVFAATSSGIDNPGFRFYVKEKGGSYGSAVASYTFDALGEFVVKVEALEDNAGDPVASDEQEIAVYDTHTFTNGSTIYVDFSAMTEGAKGVNYPKTYEAYLEYDSEGAGTFKTVTFTADVTWTTNDDFIKTEKGGWAGLKFSVPGAGENCAVVAADGASYTWTTYVAPDPVYTVAGSASAFGSNWNVNDAANEMVLDGGVYKLTKTGLELIAGDIEFKVVKDHAYANGEWPAYPNNYVLNIAETGKYTIAITFDPSNIGDEISATATKTGDIVIIPTVKVNGSWDWLAETTLSGDETSVSATINLTPADTYYFKMIVGGNYRSNKYWYHRDFTGAEGITMNDDDMSITVDKPGDYTFTWTFATNALSITFPDLDLVRDNLSVGKWGTLCPKQTVENVRGADFYQISHLEEQGGLPYNMVFEQIVGKTLTAGQPYFFIASAEKIEGAKTGAILDEAYDAGVNGFYGYIGATSWELPYVADYDPAADNTFVIYDNSVYRINQSGTMLKSERCYIKINATEPTRTGSAPVPGRARFMINVNGHNTPTGIDQITNEQLPMTNKVIIDGQLFIIRGEKMYDATGHLVK